MKYTFSFLLFSVFLLTQCASTNKGNVNRTEPYIDDSTPGTHFVVSQKMMPVMEMAKAENKLVFVDFYADWCAPCKMMDRDVYPDPNLGKFFNDNFLNYKVDAEKGSGTTLATIYSIKIFPTLLFLDADGNVLVRKEGAAYHTEMRELAEQAIARSNGVPSGSR